MLWGPRGLQAHGFEACPRSECRLGFLTRGQGFLADFSPLYFGGIRIMSGGGFVLLLLWLGGGGVGTEVVEGQGERADPDPDPDPLLSGPSPTQTSQTFYHDSIRLCPVLLLTPGSGRGGGHAGLTA
ncbi:hypothetical protein E2C01_006612 [Portunus trituberculatus]|uniref:Uncharacterized protein n=1 Tax=Portunus trituberculatus TaxID=210409 RepID=A0A5B7D298_PORTR|nr:hypothetical protein [Portunus trituberculatus]